MRRIIAVIDRDGEYRERLAAAINGQETGLKAVTFSDPESFLRHAGEYDVRLVLVAEPLSEKLGNAAPGEVRIVLSEDGLVSGGSGPAAVRKYSRTDEILRRALEIYSEKNPDRLLRIGGGPCRITGVFSPVGRCGKTTLAVTLGLLHAREGRTLLLLFDEYAGVFRHIASRAVSDMTDVIYAFRQGDCSWSRLAGAVSRFGELDYIAPVRYAEDLTRVTQQEVSSLVSAIAEEGGYLHIVVDMGIYGRIPAELTEICSALYMPYARDPEGLCKKEELEEALRAAGRTELEEKIRSVVLPPPETPGELMLRPGDYLRGPLRSLAEGLIRDEK